MNILDKLNESAAYINSKTSAKPLAGIILGSGLGSFTQRMQVEHEISYADVPHFPESTVEGHSGKLMFGTLAGTPVICMAGRFHFYEGYTPQDVAYPVRVMKHLGVEDLFISNAAGGMNANFRVGDLMIIRDHISFFAPNPLLGKNIDALGPRFPDMSEPYDLKLIEQALKIAADNDILVHQGVYCGVTGPTFETRSEYKMLHLLGGDAVGMSTVQEVITARHMNMKVFAMSVITDIGIREEMNTITHQEVLEAAAASEPKMTLIFEKLIGSL